MRPSTLTKKDHSCQHCQDIVITLPNYDRENGRDASWTLRLDVEDIKSAVQDGCIFFEWAVALNEDEDRSTYQKENLDDHIASLPGMVEDQDTDENESTLAESVPDHLAINESKIDSGSDDQALELVSLDPEANALSDTPLQHVQLHLETSKMHPGRCRLGRDMRRGDAPGPRNSAFWNGPWWDLVVEKPPHFVPEDRRLETDLTNFIKTRSIMRSPSSLESFGLARSWLSTCLKEHRHDQEHTLDVMPTRLIHVKSNVEGSTDAHIVLSSDIGKAPYLTLSYCWGGDQESKTTNKSLLESQGVVVVSELPQTIIDAITVTINMGYNHLWVDSICIIQDNEEDRTREIARMPAIYTNAVCSIAVSYPDNAREGFLGDRTRYTDRIMALQAKLTYNTIEQEAQWVHTIPIDDEDLLFVEPLAERGWCLQERLLSTRVLEYRRNQIRFLCPFTGDHDVTKADGWTQDWPTNVDNIWFPKASNGFRPATLYGWEIDNEDHFKKIWYSIVDAYSARKLTFATDRTLAISAIAQRLASMNKCNMEKTYIAGHWLRHFPQDLLWYWRSPDWIRNRRETRRGPTWAWTSMDTEVQYAQEGSFDDRISAELLDYSIKLQDTRAPFGDVESAVLTIKSRITVAEFRVTGLEYLPRTVKLHDKITGEEICVAYPDIMTGPEEEEYIEDVILVLLQTDEKKGADTGNYVAAEGLILTEELRNNGRRTFSRIGSWSAWEYLAKGEKQAPIQRAFEGRTLEVFDLV